VTTILGLGLLGVAGYILYKNWDKITHFSGDMTVTEPRNLISPPGPPFPKSQQCPQGTVGTWPNCVPVKNTDQNPPVTQNPPATEQCPDGTQGVFPNCKPIPTPDTDHCQDVCRKFPFSNEQDITRYIDAWTKGGPPDQAEMTAILDCWAKKGRC
jgi:hypothetical protein